MTDNDSNSNKDNSNNHRGGRSGRDGGGGRGRGRRGGRSGGRGRGKGDSDSGIKNEGTVTTTAATPHPSDTVQSVGRGNHARQSRKDEKVNNKNSTAKTPKSDNIDDNSPDDQKGGGGRGGRRGGRGRDGGRGRGGGRGRNGGRGRDGGSGRDGGRGRESGREDDKQAVDQLHVEPTSNNRDKNPEPKKKQKNQSNNSKKEDDTKPSSAPLSPSVPPNQSQQTSDINYGRGQKITILHIAEKPSIAQAIARGLCSAGNSTNQRGKTLPVHEFTTSDRFPKAPHAASVRHCVTSVAGHVFSVDFPPQFQSWDSVDPAELFHAPVVKKPNKGSVIKHLQDEARGADFIVLWMDCDREGENINFEVLDCCMHLMSRGGGGGGGSGGSNNYDRVYRAYFSAINPSDIQKAYQSLGKPDKNQSLSVDARQELDLKVGVAFSRFQTRYFQGRYGDLDSAVLSYGPCQTPTLGFCVQRHVDIETFKPEPYWMLDLGILKRGHSLKATWGSGRSFHKHKIEALVQKCLDAPEGGSSVEVANVVTKDKKQGRPIPLNTVALLKACSKALGIGPHGAMQVAERLYLSGYLSYPRTESSAYPKSFDIRDTLRQQSHDSRWGHYVTNLLANPAAPLKSRGGVDMGDHPPITPCRAAPYGELSGDMARVYELVVRHFIASVSCDAVWRSTRVDFVLPALEDQGNFSVSGKTIVEKGFLEVLLHKEYGDEASEKTEGLIDEDEEERVMPEFTKGEIIPIFRGTSSSSGGTRVAVATGLPCWASLGMKEKMTTPPTYLTESELIGKMEKHGIGTDASIATHIQNIQNRNYVGLETGRRLIPNKLGLVLVQGYHMIDSGLVLPKVRSDIEDQCSRIAKGLADRDDVVRKAIQIFHDKYQFFVSNIEKMDVLFGSSFAKLADVGKPFTRCGLSNRYLQYIEGPPPRLYNKYTETVYPLPSGGTVKQWTGRKCSVPDCNFELCLYSCGNPPRTFPLCPNCCNSPDWSLDTDTSDAQQDPADKDDQHKERQIQKMAGKKLTLECPLPDHHPIIEEMTVSPDPDSGGVLILDPHMGPKWRLVSTRDPTIVHLPKTIDKVTVMNKKDDVLGCHYMKIEFKAGESPLKGGETTHRCCFPVDETMQTVSRVFHGSDRLKATGRGGRGRGGRGRGGGRGGRGRG